MTCSNILEKDNKNLMLTEITPGLLDLELQ